MSEIVPDYRIAPDFNLERLEQILKNKPGDSSVLFALGEMALRRGRNLIALSAFYRLLELNPETVEIRLALSKIFADQKMFNEAFNELVEVLKLDPSSLEARVLVQVFSQEAKPSREVEAKIKLGSPASFDSKRVNLYLQQLSVERDWLLSDQREISTLLETAPMETFLEYNREVIARKLRTIEELFNRTHELAGIKPENRKASPPAALKGKKNQAKPETSLGQRGRLLLALVEAVDPFLEKIKNIDGVLDVFVIGITGEVYHSKTEETVPWHEVMHAFSSSIQLVWNFAPKLAFWVIEFRQGILVIQTIAPKLFLCIRGKSSLTFGALRYTLDKNLSLIEKALESLEVSALER